jgi:hypothetical protein
MKYIEAQLKERELHAMLSHAKIISGAYKLSEATRLGGTPLTDEEKLKDEVDTMMRHIHLYSDIMEHLGNRRNK